MKEHEMHALVSLPMCKKIASKDAPSVSTKSSYADDNIVGYYILCNTWLHQIKHFAPHVMPRVMSEIVNRGLIPVINEMQTEADRVVRDEPYGPWATLLNADLVNGSSIDKGLAELVGLPAGLGSDPEVTVLQLLRYPKRFSPRSNDKIQSDTLRDFVNYENRSRQLQNHETYSYWRITSMMRELVSNLYDWDSIISEIDAISPHDWRFSNGAAANSSPAYGDKVKVALQSSALGYYQVPHFGQWMLPLPEAQELTPTTCIVQAVPKSYKASRIIAMDDTVKLAYCKAVEDIFRRHDVSDRTGISLDDQTINQELARVGSATGRFATLDASHASDLITKSLLADIFPSAYTKRIMPLLPEFCNIKGKVMPLQMASTSGHTLTFRHETIVYKIAGLLGALLTKALVPESDQEPFSHAFGDDTVINTDAYDATVYVFQTIGLKINEGKSFTGSQRFRESCGRDFLGGKEVTSSYFPRFPIIGSAKNGDIKLVDKTYADNFRGKLDTALTMLIDLQKKLIPISDTAARFVACVVKDAYPKMTTSVIGSVCSDLWDYVDTGLPRNVVGFKLEKGSIERKTEISEEEYNRLLNLFRVAQKPANWGRNLHRYLPYKILKVKDDGTLKGKKKFTTQYFRVDIMSQRTPDKWKTIPLSEVLSDVSLEEFTRRASLDKRHFMPRVSFRSTSRTFSTEDVAVYEYWKLTNFLQFGPRYEDELSAVLGISQRPISIEEFYGVKNIGYVIK